MIKFESLKGKLLIAMPQMEDPRFHHSVLVMLEHNSEGAMGVLVNKLLEAVKFTELLEQLSIEQPTDTDFNYPVYFGGPVEIGRGTVIHSTDVMMAHSETLGPVATTTSIDMLARVAAGTGPKSSLFCLGYAGWTAGQLEDEIRQNAWLHAPLEPALLFDLPWHKRWDAAMALVGVNPDHLSAVAGSA